MKTLITILLGALLTISSATTQPPNGQAATYQIRFYEFDRTGRLDKPPIVIDPSDPTDIYLPETAYQVEITIKQKPTLQGAIYNLRGVTGIQEN